MVLVGKEMGFERWGSSLSHTWSFLLVVVFSLDLCHTSQVRKRHYTPSVFQFKRMQQRSILGNHRYGTLSANLEIEDHGISTVAIDQHGESALVA